MILHIEKAENGYIISDSGVKKRVFVNIKEVFLYMMEYFQIERDEKRSD